MRYMQRIFLGMTRKCHHRQQHYTCYFVYNTLFQSFHLFTKLIVHDYCKIQKY